MHTYLTFVSVYMHTSLSGPQRPPFKYVLHKIHYSSTQICPTHPDYFGTHIQTTSQICSAIYIAAYTNKPALHNLTVLIHMLPVKSALHNIYCCLHRPALYVPIILVHTLRRPVKSAVHNVYYCPTHTCTTQPDYFDTHIASQICSARCTSCSSSKKQLKHHWESFICA